MRFPQITVLSHLVVLTGGINRLTMLDWVYLDRPENIVAERGWLEIVMRTGNLQSPEENVPAFWHTTTIAEFHANFPHFQRVEFVGVEAFARGKEENLLKLSPEQKEVWLDLIEETGRTSEGMGMTGHFLYIGRK